MAKPTRGISAYVKLMAEIETQLDRWDGEMEAVHVAPTDKVRTLLRFAWEELRDRDRQAVQAAVMPSTGAGGRMGDANEGRCPPTVTLLWCPVCNKTDNMLSKKHYRAVAGNAEICPGQPMRVQYEPVRQAPLRGRDE